MNRATFTGNVTRDAEIKHTGGGTAVLNFSVAVNDRIKKNDEWTDYASFLDCVLFGKRAEALAKYLTKGSRVGIDAKIRHERWEKDGEKKSRVKFYVDDVTLLGGKRDGSSSNGDDALGGDGSDFEDDVPF
ncbi:MAG: single-stranded DNA-binding protein [Spirochaetota bacterium]